MTPFVVGQTYVELRSRYFPLYGKNLRFHTEDFVDLTRFLEKEKISPRSYLDFVLGILDYRRPLSPKALADPLLVQKYREMVR